jgi:hypothetical protein
MIDIDTFVCVANVSKTGGSEYNSPHHSGQDGPKKESYGPDSEYLTYNAWAILRYLIIGIVDHDEAVRAAQKHGSGSSDLFSSALGFLGANKVIDELWTACDEQKCLIPGLGQAE